MRKPKVDRHKWGESSPINMTRQQLLDEVRRLRNRVTILENREETSQVSAVDRNGRKYNRAQMIEIFERLYRENPKAILLMFPTMTKSACGKRAIEYGVVTRIPHYSDEEDAILRKFYPDYKKIHERLIGRNMAAIRERCRYIGLAKQDDKAFTPEEDALIMKRQIVPGRTLKAVSARRGRLGVNGRILDAVLKLSTADLMALVEAAVPWSYPAQVRQDAVQMVVEQCLGGKCWPRPADLAAASKKAITAVYKLHPERGAPISMDAKLFDDGEATVGDRISADAFHF